MPQSENDIVTKEQFSRFVQNAIDMGVSEKMMREQLQVSPATLKRWRTGHSSPATYAREVIISRINNMLGLQTP